MCFGGRGVLGSRSFSLTLSLGADPGRDSRRRIDTMLPAIVRECRVSAGPVAETRAVAPRWRRTRSRQGRRRGGCQHRGRRSPGKRAMHRMKPPSELLTHGQPGASATILHSRRTPVKRPGPFEAPDRGWPVGERRTQADRSAAVPLLSAAFDSAMAVSPGQTTLLLPARRCEHEC